MSAAKNSRTLHAATTLSSFLTVPHPSKKALYTLATLKMLGILRYAQDHNPARVRPIHAIPDILSGRVSAILATIIEAFLFPGEDGIHEEERSIEEADSRSHGGLSG